MTMLLYLILGMSQDWGGFYYGRNIVDVWSNGITVRSLIFKLQIELKP
jgi:hypothetical protein